MNQSQQPEPMPELINVMEYVVSAMVEDVLKEEQMCACAQCRLDVMAIALNNLPPKYVVTAQGKAYETYKLQGLPQSRIAVYQAVLHAAHLVKERPRHGEERKFRE